jgi:excisionase family DNA binding protein
VEQDTLKVAEAAARLGVGPETVRVWLREGRLAGFRPGGSKLGWRIPAAEVERIGQQTQRSGPLTTVQPVSAITVYADSATIAAIRCGACHSRLERGQACPHLRFAAAPAAGPELSVELSLAPGRPSENTHN